MTSSDIHAIEVSDAPIALCDVDVLELDIHVVFGFDKLAAIGLPAVDFNRNLVALGGEELLAVGGFL